MTHNHRIQCLVALLIPMLRPVLSAGISTVIPLKSVAYGTSFDIEVQFGDQTLWVSADTGSADLWIVSPDWQCFFGAADDNRTPVPREKCRYGNQTYTESSTFTPYDPAWLGVHYGAGNIYGTLGFEDIKVGDILISQQEMGVANASTAYADGWYSGIMGLGYPTISQIHPSNYTGDTSLELLADRWRYPTVTQRMAQQGVEPYFAFALERSPRDQLYAFGGYLSFATLPPVSHGDFVTVPVEVTDSIPAAFTNGTKKITEWTITVDAVTWNGKTVSKPFQAVVDTANWLNVLPEEIASEINAAFDPPAKPTKGLGQSYYTVACNATPPASHGLQIGGYMFTIDPADMIYRDYTGQCYSSVAPVLPAAGISLPFIGDAFMKNAVTVFDYGKNEMRFAPRHGSGNETATSSQPPIASATGSASAHGIPFLKIVAGLALAVMIGYW